MKYKPTFSINAFREVKFNFKTKQNNTLLLYGPDTLSDLFTSFEIVNGKLVFRFNNGYRPQDTVYTSTVSVNDGKVHAVVKSRTEFKLDDKIVASFDRQSQELSAAMLFIGGVPFGMKPQSRY